MFVIWSEQSWNHISMWKNVQSVLYFHNVPRNIARELHKSQLLQCQTMTMPLREITKTVMTVIIMKKNKKVNWFNKLNVSCSIWNWFSLKCFEYQSLFYPILVITKLRFNFNIQYFIYTRSTWFLQTMALKHYWVYSPVKIINATSTCCQIHLVPFLPLTLPNSTDFRIYCHLFADIAWVLCLLLDWIYINAQKPSFSYLLWSFD